MSSKSMGVTCVVFSAALEVDQIMKFSQLCTHLGKQKFPAT